MSKGDVQTEIAEKESTIGVRPPKHLRPQLRQLAAELDCTEGQLLHRCAEAIINMVNAPIPRIPRIVTKARLFREHGVTALDPDRDFEELRVLRVPHAAEDEPGYSPRSRPVASADGARNQRTKGKRGVPASDGSD